MTIREKEIADAVQLINSVLTSFKITGQIASDDISLSPNLILDKVGKIGESPTFGRIRRTLSDFVFNAYSPRPTGSTFYHYTKLSAFRKIIKGEFKIPPLVTNENFDEFKTFYSDHELTGYKVHLTETGQLYENEIMQQCYALCFATPVGLTDLMDQTLWRSFADNGGGVRIEFNIQTHHTDFRSIYYRDPNFNKSNLLLKRLNEEAMLKMSRTVAIAGLSKLGAFYLPDYNVENEVRFLLKKNTEEYPFNFDDSLGNIALPFVSAYATFKIAKVKAGPNCDVTEVQQLLKANGYDITSTLDVA
jgi:hypothetical protein